nr:immunoglobulin heavy chain junction region [Mus musculus]
CARNYYGSSPFDYW